MVCAMKTSRVSSILVHMGRFGVRFSAFIEENTERWRSRIRTGSATAALKSQFMHAACRACDGDIQTAQDHCKRSFPSRVRCVAAYGSEAHGEGRAAKGREKQKSSESKRDIGSARPLRLRVQNAPRYCLKPPGGVRTAHNGALKAAAVTKKAHTQSSASSLIDATLGQRRQNSWHVWCGGFWCLRSKSIITGAAP